MFLRVRQNETTSSVNGIKLDPGRVAALLAIVADFCHRAKAGHIKDISLRKFLVVLDDSHEALNAIRFAALRAASTGAAVQVLAVIPAAEIQHGLGVADVMRAEAQERIEAHFEVFAKWMRERPGVEPELVIREGDPPTELVAQIADDPQIGVCVLGAVAGATSPGPLLARLLREVGTLGCAITIVPGELSRERLDEITR